MISHSDILFDLEYKNSKRDIIIEIGEGSPNEGVFSKRKRIYQLIKE